MELGQYTSIIRYLFMIKIKISIPGCLPNIKNKNSSISKFIPNSTNSIGDYHFFANQNIEEADYWFIIDDIINEKESCKVDKNNIYFLSAEVPFVTKYFDDKAFLSQFSKSFSPHCISDTKNITSLPFLPFMINSNYGSSVWQYDAKYNYDYLKNLETVEKTKNISLIFSDKGSNSQKMTYFHEARYNFCIALKNYFKDKIDIFGAGHNPIDRKAEAILPYKYHISLENQSLYNVVTEKLYDSFLGLSYPIYFGAPNIDKFFDKKSFTSINIFDFKSSVETIESVMESNLWEKSQKYLIESKNKVLDEYSIFSRIVKICQHEERIDKKKLTTIYNRNFFQPKKKIKKRIIKNFFKKIKHKFL
jgi:hypothetical protein